MNGGKILAYSDYCQSKFCIVWLCSIAVSLWRAHTPAAQKKPAGPNVATIALAPQVSLNWWFSIMANTAYSDYNMTANYMMYMPLIQFTTKDQVDYARSLAKNVSNNASGTVYKITLHKKWHWSNGRPVTAEDVAWTIKFLEYVSSGKSPWNYGGAGIGGLPVRWKSVKVTGPDSLIVTLNKPSNPDWFIHNGLGQVMPVPKSVWDIHHSLKNEANFIKTVSNQPSSKYYKVVDGPFYYAPSLSKPNNEYWTFIPNPHYDGHKATLSKVISNIMNRLIAQTYAPGTPSEVARAMNNYQSYAAHHFPVLWMPWTAQFGETATYLHGVNRWYNPITALNAPNHWTISQ